MNRITFQIKEHPGRPGVQFVQVLIDGISRVAIVPGGDGQSTLYIQSAHFKDDREALEIPGGVDMVATSSPVNSLMRIKFDLPPPKT